MKKTILIISALLIVLLGISFALFKERNQSEPEPIKEETTIVSLTHFGYIKRVPINTYKTQ